MTALMHIATRPQKPSARTSLTVCSVIALLSSRGIEVPRYRGRAAPRYPGTPIPRTSLSISPSTNHAARQRASHLLINQHRHSVDDDVDHADGEVMRVFVLRFVGDALGIE